MKILDGMGKTTYFFKLHKDGVVKHAQDMQQLLAAIHSTKSSLVPRKPTLINVWFPVDFSLLKNEFKYDCYLELHRQYTKSLDAKLEKAYARMKRTMVMVGIDNIILCDIPSQVLNRGDQPPIHNMVVTETQPDWSDMDYILALGEKFEYKWLSCKINTKFTNLLRNYLNQAHQ